MLEHLKNVLRRAGVDLRVLYDHIGSLSLALALRVNGYAKMVDSLRKIVPDISDQEESEKDVFSDYLELKRRSLQAFQCDLMLKALTDISRRNLTVVDIGDSAGTHMLYLKELTKETRQIETVSVNLDRRAIKKIESRGLKAVLCRAEELDLGETVPDLCTSFEMIEHLHDPATFFRRLAKFSKCDRLVLTVPYMQHSRVGLHNIRRLNDKAIFAEDEHIFELDPEDWSLLIRHSGWKVVCSKVYYQYPLHIPVVSRVLRYFWARTDFEGFWGAILEKDTTLSDLYTDWNDWMKK
jgi:Methyltransferase domain.